MSFVTARVAPSADDLAISCIAWCESINSHTPSDAITKYRCFPSDMFKTSWVTSGSAITPTLLTRWSPIERAMAKPGSVISLSSHTRAGPPHSSSGGEIVPPAFLMRALSFGVSGLWSCDRSLTSVLVHVFSPAEAVQRTARESPAHAVQMWSSSLSAYCRMSTATAVVPLSSASIFLLACSNSSVFTKAFLSACATPLFSPPLVSLVSSSSCCCVSISGTVLTTKSDTMSPLDPWPSYTEKRASVHLMLLYGMSSGKEVDPRSWLIFPWLSPCLWPGSTPWQENVPQTSGGMVTSIPFCPISGLSERRR
mmetsp:Transcript_51878/g.103237  ORF Transcript_51878/g.103237 Transcript_51878/m.103237 type:complete len:310 (-) Transcript_51878:169-1098(-)